MWRLGSITANAPSPIIIIATDSSSRRPTLWQHDFRT
jgi:hypothetical protein